jgi:uncharacterized membrane protein YgdD (TMEM256/DUF423 family)
LLKGVAILGALAVAAGAFGAHGLRGQVDARQLAAWTTASEYHLLHSVVLLALALFANATRKTVTLPASLFLAGVGLFSGSLYLMVLSGQTWLGAITPIGGLCLMAGWLSLFTLARD